VIYAARYAADELAALQAIADGLSDADKPFLFISGASVGAEETAGGSGTFQFSEDSELPSPPRGSAIRLQSEDLVRRTTSARGFVVRPPLVHGAGGSVQIPLLATKARELGHVPYVGAGENLWGFVHVEDLAQLALNALQKGAAGSVYHAVAGEVAFKDLAHAIGEVLSKPARSVPLSEAEAIFGKFAARVMLGSSCRPTSSKTCAALDWTPNQPSVLKDIRSGSYRAAWT
jgi:nucleoside-diphosphate-sugar epimerase